MKGRRRVHLPRGNAAPEEGLDDDGSPLKKRGGPAAAPPRGIEPRPLAAMPPGVPSKRQEARMRECEDAMMEDTASRRGYAPTAAWDEGNMIQAMARMKNPTIAWRFGDG